MTVYVHSFHYSSASNGIKITYELVKRLNNLGICAKNLCFDKYVQGAKIPLEYLVNTVFCSIESFPEIEPEDIVIYPEHVKGNPLKARNVVRYLLNKPYFIFGYGIDYSPTDYLMSFSQLISKTLPYLYVLIDERPFFEEIRKNNPKKQSTVSIYFGKCNLEEKKHYSKLLREIKKRYRHVNIITRQRPTRVEALSLISESIMLVSFDPLSNINYEATLLETPVLLADNSFHLDSIALPAAQCGIFYDIGDYSNALQEVKESYKNYCDYLLKQDCCIMDAFQSWKTHFNDLSKNNYYSINKVKNEEQAKVDFIQYTERKEKVFCMINMQTDIPICFLKALGMSYDKLKPLKVFLKYCHLFPLAKKIKKILEL